MAAEGEQLRRARQQAGLSQYQLARATRGAVSAPGLCRIELGQRYPTLATLEALTRVLPVRVQVEGGRTRVVSV